MIIVQRYAHFLATGLHIWPASLSRDGRERGGRGQMEVCKVCGLARIISHVPAYLMSRAHVSYGTRTRIFRHEPTAMLSATPPAIAAAVATPFLPNLDAQRGRLSTPACHSATQEFHIYYK